MIFYRETNIQTEPIKANRLCLIFFISMVSLFSHPLDESRSRVHITVQPQPEKLTLKCHFLFDAFASFSFLETYDRNGDRLISDEELKLFIENDTIYINQVRVVAGSLKLAFEKERLKAFQHMLEYDLNKDGEFSDRELYEYIIDNQIELFYLFKKPTEPESRVLPIASSQVTLRTVYRHGPDQPVHILKASETLPYSKNLETYLSMTWILDFKWPSVKKEGPLALKIEDTYSNISHASLIEIDATKVPKNILYSTPKVAEKDRGEFNFNFLKEEFKKMPKSRKLLMLIEKAPTSSNKEQ